MDRKLAVTVVLVVLILCVGLDVGCYIQNVAATRGKCARDTEIGYIVVPCEMSVAPGKE